MLPCRRYSCCGLWGRPTGCLRVPDPPPSTTQIPEAWGPAAKQHYHTGEAGGEASHCWASSSRGEMTGDRWRAELVMGYILQVSHSLCVILFSNIPCTASRSWVSGFRVPSTAVPHVCALILMMPTKWRRWDMSWDAHSITEPHVIVPLLLRVFSYKHIIQCCTSQQSVTRWEQLLSHLVLPMVNKDGWKHHTHTHTHTRTHAVLHTASQHTQFATEKARVQVPNAAKQMVEPLNV